MESSHLGQIAVLVVWGWSAKQCTMQWVSLQQKEAEIHKDFLGYFMFGGHRFLWRPRSHNCPLTRKQTSALTQNQVCCSNGDVNQWMCFMSEIPCHALFFLFLLTSSWRLFPHHCLLKSMQHHYIVQEKVLLRIN